MFFFEQPVTMSNNINYSVKLKSKFYYIICIKFLSKRIQANLHFIGWVWRDVLWVKIKVEYPIRHNKYLCQTHAITQSPTISFFSLPFYTCTVWYVGLLMTIWSTSQRPTMGVFFNHSEPHGIPMLARHYRQPAPAPGPLCPFPHPSLSARVYRQVLPLWFFLSESYWLQIFEDTSNKFLITPMI